MDACYQRVRGESGRSWKPSLLWAGVRLSPAVLFLMLACRLPQTGDQGNPETPREEGAMQEATLAARTYRSKLTGGERTCWVHFPRGYANRRDWPLILFLHGIGERGDDPERALLHGVVKEAARPDRELPFVVIGPHCPKLESEGEPHTSWLDMEAEVLELLDSLLAEGRVDPDRVYLTGLSLGGRGAWHLAARHPERWAAVAPICGWGDPAEVTRIGQIPVWAFHGREDATIPWERSREMVEALRTVNPKARLTIYPDLGHNSWDRVYQGEEIYAWFLQHRRQR